MIDRATREDAIIQIVRRRVQECGLHDFVEQAISAAIEQFKREPTSGHRAIRTGILVAHEYEARYWH